MLGSSKFNAISASFTSTRPVAEREKELKNYLLFQIGSSDRALLEAEIVTEIVTVPEQEILPIPQMPYCVMGIYHWRSEMLWIVDLENLLGYPPSLREGSSTRASEASKLLVMVLQLQGQALGTIVSNVSHIIQQDLDKLHPPSLDLFTEDIQSFLQGYFTNSEGEIMMLLDAGEIFKYFSFSPEILLE